MDVYFFVAEPNEWTVCHRLIVATTCGGKWDMVYLHPVGAKGYLRSGVANVRSQPARRRIRSLVGSDYDLDAYFRQQGDDFGANLMYLHTLCAKLNESIKQEGI